MNASELKKHFGVYGHFYDLNIQGSFYPCRSTLEIIAHDLTPLKLDEIITFTSQAVVLMMNPGSSRPVDADYRPSMISRPDHVMDSLELVPTVPDTTQYQVMRIMLNAGWKHVRVLNLSDLRQSKSGEFIAMVERLSDGGIDFPHSVFDLSRQTELDQKIADTRNLVVGWGTDRGLVPLIKLAQEGLKRYDFKSTIGVPYGDEGLFYRHPSPMLQRMKEEWLAQVTAML